jgi:hypothetical protein
MAENGPRILARTLFQQMVGSGYSVNQILTVSSELIGLLTSLLRERKQPESLRDTNQIVLRPTVIEE